MQRYTAESFDVAVIGAGHAGIEAALSASRLGYKTILFSISLDSVGNMPCNPSIGGTAKGHLVREIDALGGEMGKAADACAIQIKMLNRGKGPAVHSLRAQIDRRRYTEYMKQVIEKTENLDLKLSISTGDDKANIQKLIDFLDSCDRSHRLDQLGLERLIRAAQKIKEENPDTTADLGFLHYTLVEPSTDTLDKLEKFDADEYGMFASDMLNEFGLPTVLSTWLVRDGYGLTATPEKLVFADYESYYIGKHLYLITQNLTKEAIDAMLVKYETDGKFNPENIVLFGYSFTWTEMETLKTNLKRLKDIKNLHVNFDVRY